MTGSLHSIHPMLVHFTIALLITSSMLLLIGKLFVNKTWAESCRTAGSWNMIIGALFSLATVVSGFQAFATVAHDTPSHLAMIEHRNIAVPATILWCILAIWRVQVLRNERRSGWPFFVGVFAAFSLLVVTGYKGGDLVFHHGLGVASLPASTGEGHDHAHAPGEGHGDTPAEPVQSSADTSIPHDNSDGHAHPTAIEQPAELANDAVNGHDNSDGHAHPAAVEEPVQAVVDAVNAHDNSDGHSHEAIIEQPIQPTADLGHAHDSDSQPHAH